MHDKTIRRRRAVLVLLVAISLILLTDYFGESPSSPLHQVQRGIVEVLSPVQDGASKVLSPVRDVGNWVSSTLRAKSQVASLQSQVDSLRNEVSQRTYNQAEGQQAIKLLGLDKAEGLDAYDPVGATVISKNPVLWYETIEVNKGRDDGVKAGDAVVGDGGLVGDVSIAGPDYAEVNLLTSPSFAAGAMVENGAQDAGELQPEVGSQSTLQLNYLPKTAEILYGQEVVTSGFKYAQNPSIQSLYPPGIPIGQVSNRDTQDSVLNNQQVDVTPAVNLMNLDAVQIITKYGGS